MKRANGERTGKRRGMNELFSDFTFFSLFLSCQTAQLTFTTYAANIALMSRKVFIIKRTCTRAKVNFAPSNKQDEFSFPTFLRKKYLLFLRSIQKTHQTTFSEGRLGTLSCILYFSYNLRVRHRSFIFSFVQEFFKALSIKPIRFISYHRSFNWDF